MNEIICPHCKKAFKVDEAGFADILKQVRDGEFEKELHERAEMFEREKRDAVRIASVETEGRLREEAAKKDAEIAELKVKRQAEINELKAKQDASEAELKAQKELALSQLESKKDAELSELKARLHSIETENRLTVTEAVTKVEKERDEFAMKLTSKDAEYKATEASLKERYEIQLKDRDDAIDRLKDMKAKLSVKLVGENLEQHCQNEFNAVRTGQFPYAYFEKDNEAIREDDEAKGTKGDYVYRDYDAPQGAEIISIMFEMKDEQDASANKRTVESHLEKLDRDRKKKGLEYAVLVTLLEADNDLYNRGIVDVSYKYPKMFVIRPQFFLPLISFLKNANLKVVEATRQLMVAQSQNVDITTFESDMNSWKDGWVKNIQNAGKKHFEGIDAINKAIKDLEKARDALMTSDKHLLSAENKMDQLTIKRLTRNNPTMAEKFGELGS